MKQIAHHPFLFAKRRMEDDNEERPIRIRKWGLFTQKHIIHKKQVMGRRYEKMIKDIDSVFEAICSTGDSREIDSKMFLENLLHDAYNDHDAKAIGEFWAIYQDYLKNN